MRVNVNITKFEAKFKKPIDKIEAFLKAEIAATVEDIADDARVRVPVDTGLLKGSIESQSNELKGTVGASKHYAPYIEFGTGGLVDVPAGMEDFAMTFIGNGIKQIDLKPRPFLFPAYFANIAKLTERIKTKIETK